MPPDSTLATFKHVGTGIWAVGCGDDGCVSRERATMAETRKHRGLWNKFLLQGPCVVFALKNICTPNACKTRSLERQRGNERGIAFEIHGETKLSIWKRGTGGEDGLLKFPGPVNTFPIEHAAIIEYSQAAGPYHQGGAFPRNRAAKVRRESRRFLPQQFLLGHVEGGDTHRDESNGQHDHAAEYALASAEPMPHAPHYLLAPRALPCAAPY